MITKVSRWVLILNLVCIPFCMCETMEKVTSSSTVANSNSSSPNLLSLSQNTLNLISTWSTLVNLLKVRKEEGELIVRLTPVLKLANTIHKFEAENRQILDSDELLKTKFDSLKNDIPERVKNLVWGSKCTIRNVDGTGDLYLNIDNSTQDTKVKKLEMSNETKTFWNLQPTNKFTTTEAQVDFTIQSFNHPEDILCVENKKVEIAEGWTDDMGTPTICQAGQLLPGKLIYWTLEPYISAGGPSKGEVIYWMATELRNKKERSKYLYLSGTLEAADFFINADGSSWEFDCKE